MKTRTKIMVSLCTTGWKVKGNVDGTVITMTNSRYKSKIFLGTKKFRMGKHLAKSTAINSSTIKALTRAGELKAKRLCEWSIH